MEKNFTNREKIMNKEALFYFDGDLALEQIAQSAC